MEFTIEQVDNGFILYKVVGHSYNLKFNPIKVFEDIEDLSCYICEYYREKGEVNESK